MARRKFRSGGSTSSTALDRTKKYKYNDAGTLSEGRQKSVFKNDVTSKTDIFPEYGGKAAQKLFSRDSHTVTYTNSVGPLSIDNMVKVDGSTGKSGVDVYETAATMSINDSIDVGLGYSDDKVNDVQYYGAGVTVALSDDTSVGYNYCLLYTSPSPRDQRGSSMPSSA